MTALPLLLQAPANRMGSADGYTLARLKIAQAVITLRVFVLFAMAFMKPPMKLDGLWAALCLGGAVYFISRA